MRIVTWNVNGLKTIRHYRPWINLSSWSDCLNYLNADIICFQEVKATRKVVLNDREMCMPLGYTSYFDLHPTKGYSGVVTYVKDSSCRPRAAERGITGSIADPRSIGCYPDPREELVWDSIDVEGRACVLDCGLFVLFNLYCPNETDESRREYKMAYNAALQERAHRLLDAGRHVMIVGDVNIAHLPIDHCDSVGRESATHFLSAHPARAWLDSFLAPRGRFHDVTRNRHPGRKGMYTVWNTLIDARPANYGTRIDYILVDEGLLPWFKDSDVAQDVYGSDHCPVWVDLHDEIVDQNGKNIVLRNVMGASEGHAARKAPPLASCNWPELSQRGIKSFFGGQSSTPVPRDLLSSPGTSVSNVATDAREPAKADSPRSPVRNTGSASPAKASEYPTADLCRIRDSPASSVSPAKRRKSEASVFVKSRNASDPSNGSSNLADAKAKGRHKEQGQLKLKSFFYQAPGVSVPPRAVGETSKESHHIDLSEDSSRDQPHSHVGPDRSVAEEFRDPPGSPKAMSDARDIVSIGAPELAAPSGASKGSGPQSDDVGENDAATRVSTSLAWGSIFAPPPAPLCKVHNEVCTAWTVNKSGANHGRKFYLCSRPVGHGYERSGRDKKDVDPQYRCDFFCWANEGRARAARVNARNQADRLGAEAGEATLRDVAWTAPALGSGDRRGRSFGKRSNSSVNEASASPTQQADEDAKEAHKRVKW